MAALKHIYKKAGNENFKLGKYTEAVENYTAALSSNIKSRPFVAICFGNRAAAHQASGKIADAIADCSMAMALDGNYAKDKFEWKKLEISSQNSTVPGEDEANSQPTIEMPPDLDICV